MPTSFAHALGGLAVAEGSPLARRWSRARALLFCAIVANLPDADFLPGLVQGDASRYHRHGTHSLLATLLLALAGALWLRGRRRASRGDAVRFGSLTFLVYGSHLLLDMLVTTPTDSSGVPLLWPFLPARYYLPVHLPGPLAALLDLDFDKHAHFFHALVSVHGAEVFLGHALLFAPLPILAWLVRRAFQLARGPARSRPERRPPRPRFAPAPEPAAED